MKPITIKNETILKYFEQHPEIDAEQSFLLFIDILEKFGNRIFEKMSTSINQQILTSLHENTKQLTTINENIKKINSETINQLYLKMIEIEKEYIENMKTLFLTNTINTTEKITSHIEKNNINLIDKTSILINELLPKNNEHFYNMISEKVNSIIIFLKDETEKIQKAASNENMEIIVKSYFTNTSNQNRELIEKISSIVTEIPKSNDTHYTNINGKIHEISALFKEENEKIQKTIQSNELENNLKITFSTFEKNNQTLIDKTIYLLHEIIPKSNETVYNTINNIQTSIKQETDKIYNLFSKEDEKINQKFIEIERNFINMFSTMQTNLQQPIHSYINTSEERINKNITNISEMTTKSMNVQTQLYTEMNEFLNKYRSSTIKGAVHENQLENLLSEMHPSAEIVNNTGLTGSCDFLLKRKDYSDILFENKHYSSNVPSSEVKKFEKDCTNIKAHGIFLSQISGISTKENFHIDFKDGLILIYLHNVDYSKDKIRVAIELIDGLSVKMNQIREKENNNIDIVINRDVLAEINKEYREFALKKDNMITYIKNFSKTALLNMEEIKMPCLNKFLSTVFVLENTANELKNEIRCKDCGGGPFEPIRGLSTHRKKCPALITSTPKKLENTLTPTR
jgi:hypothetical protein